MSMTARRLIVSLALLVTAALAAAAPAGAIVGGTTVPDGQRPYVAYVTINRAFACTGTLVAPTWVVTAGHCSSITGAAAPTPVGTPGQLIEVSLGSTTPGAGEKPAVRRAVLPPSYLFTNGQGNDVSLLELARPSAQPPVKVAGRGEEGLWAPGTLATIAGFGVTSEGGSAPDRMQEAQVPIVDDATAAKAYGSSFESDTQLGAGYATGGTDTCQGDSGGPLLVSAPDGSLRLAGDTSYGNGCARANTPGIYGRLGAPVLREWIRGVAPEAVAGG